MHKQLTTLLGLFALASVGLLPVKSEQDIYEAKASYTFGYNVADAETGDVKSQTETRNGDNVQGQYSLNEANGYRRIVEYTVLPESGFRATVRHERIDSLPAVKSVVAINSAANSLSPKPIAAIAVPQYQPAQPTPSAAIAAIAVPQLRQYQPAQPAPSAASAQPAEPAQPAQPAAGIVKSYVQPAAIVRTYATPTLIHHAAPAVLHSVPTAHFVNSAPASAVIAHHPAQAVVRTALHSPHVSYVL